MGIETQRRPPAIFQQHDLEGLIGTQRDPGFGDQGIVIGSVNAESVVERFVDLPVAGLAVGDRASKRGSVDVQCYGAHLCGGVDETDLAWCLHCGAQQQDPGIFGARLSD